MTWRCLDSIYPANLPAGADAYLGYTDGHWPTYDAVKAKFPTARIISIAVFASDDADGLDVEYLDATPAQSVPWTQRQLARGVARPVLYASASRVATIISDLSAAGITRGQVRILSAHYKAGEHICGPATCGYPQADGTQWRDNAPGNNGTLIDESLLGNQFFTEAPMSANGPEHWDAADWNALLTQIWHTQQVTADGQQHWPSWVLSNLYQQANQPSDPAALAADIAAKLGPALAGQVATELSKRLAS